MNTNTEILQSEIQKIYDEHGEVTPSLVLKKAKLKRNPMHSLFEWDDTIAGNEYRLDQSRRFIRQVTIIYEDKKQKLVHVSCEGNVTKEGKYKPIGVIVKNQSEFQRAMSEALSRCRAAEKAVKDLKDAAEGEEDRITTLTVVLKGLSVASSALKSIKA